MSAFIDNSTSWEMKILPREWQNQALVKWIENYKGIVSVVTGGGKTMFAFLCILSFKKAFPKKKVIIVVPTLTLIDQWHLSLVEDLNVSPQDIACFSSQERSKVFKEINIFSINTARKKLANLKNQEDFLLIVDECHRAGSPSNSKAIVGVYCATLGLSATPDRQYDDGFLRLIKPALGEIIYEYGYTEALADKVISEFELRNIKIKFLKHEQDSYAKANKRLKYLLKQYENDKTLSPSIKRVLIQRAQISSSAIMRVPVSVKLALQNKNARLLIFHEKIDSANEIFELLSKKKLPVSLYHSKIPPVIRRNNLNLYRKGIYNILVTCKALDEGMNVPETTVAIISSSTASLRQRIQRLGRVLRPAKGKAKATIYTLYITDTEEKKLIEEFRKFEENVDISWLKLNS